MGSNTGEWPSGSHSAWWLAGEQECFEQLSLARGRAGEQAFYPQTSDGGRLGFHELSRIEGGQWTTSSFVPAPVLYSAKALLSSSSISARRSLGPRYARAAQTEAALPKPRTHVHEPSQLIWNMLFLLLVIMFGPYLAERARLPGIIGLLLGGFLLGPTGLGVFQGTAVVESLGSIGLLYLMFVAGLELDLNVFARVRSAAISFGLLTFTLPLLAGMAGARLLGFDWPASILIGSLWASHTLVMYPVVQRFGLTADPAVATTVGATVITDTLALLVLAVIAGAQAEGGGGLGSNLWLLAGLAVLVLYCTVVLTFLARWFFAGLGQDRGLRFLFIIAAFLSASLVAELGGIEGIVGAFFAGLALNRSVPNGGPLMERVEFFGGVLFIPSFLVSVGLLIDPAVLVDPHTWVLAGVFSASLVVGKAAAAVIIGRVRQFTIAQTRLVFSLSLSQAAATLAATTVGASVGLFGDDVVNAVVVVIVFSLFASSILATRSAARVAPPAEGQRPVGAAVLAAIEDADTAPRVAAVASRIARADGGNLIPVHVVADGDDVRSMHEARTVAKAIDEAVRRSGIEADPSLRVAGSIRQGVRNEISEHDASLLVVARHGALRAQDFLFGGTSEEIVASSSVAALVVELDEAPVKRVLLPIRPRDLAAEDRLSTVLALEIAVRLETSGLEVVVAIPDPERGPRELPIPEDAEVVPLAGGRTRWITATAQPGDLVLLVAGGTGLVFGIDAARVASMAGVSVGVVVGPYHQAGFRAGRDVGGTVVVGRTAV
jgi:Kef-type K+ transport system membrane component KefB/nucleotide-binding universal stress UspA family protein